MLKRFKRNVTCILTAVLCLQLAACGNTETAYEPDDSEPMQVEVPDDIDKWDFVDHLKPESFKSNGDGSVYFEAEGPDGETVRFWGEDVEITKDSIIFHTLGRIMSLDSIGRVYGIELDVSDPGDPSNFFAVFGGYNVNMDPHPGTIENMVFTSPFGRWTNDFVSKNFSDNNIEYQNYQPNFVGCGVMVPNLRTDGYENADDVVVDSLKVTYTPEEGCTGFKGVILNEEYYGFYFPGETYEAGKEGCYDPYNGVFDFTLYGIPDLVGADSELTVEDYRQMDPTGYAAFICDGNCWTVGDLKDKDGNVLDKNTAVYEKGMTLTVEVGNMSYDVPLAVYEQFTGADTMHDLVPNAYPEATGDLDVLVIPIYWQDQPETASNANLDVIRASLGRVSDMSGNVKDYSDNLEENKFSLSEYMDISSYGKLNVTSYMTDWYPAPHDYFEYEDMSPCEEIEDEITEWFYENYPNADMSKFDRDANGYIDAAILVNVGETFHEDYYDIMSYGGAVCMRLTYGPEYAGTPDRPRLNSYVNINSSNIFDDGSTLIHEFSHCFGLIDYYDVTYSGINAVGLYDMQSNNHGDWNVYSKYAVGWIEPEVVSDLEPGQSVDITIRSFADYGDAIVIPAAGTVHDTPFSEYIALELFTGTGADQYDAADYLHDITGVRMYHVDARMESHEYTPQYIGGFDPVTVGTIHYANNYSEKGLYNLEVIQEGGVNTFTDLSALDDWPYLDGDDFFEAGDEFTMNKYSSFFYDGLFDDGSEFGYSIRIVSITGTGSDAEAVIRITRQ